MITKQWAHDFAREWIEAWNSHDLERVLSHYTDDFEMSSPFIAQLSNQHSGTLTGKAWVGAYWQNALDQVPDLKLELLDVFIGVNSVAIYYKAIMGKLAVEILFFDDSGKACRGLAHYDNQ